MTAKPVHVRRATLGDYGSLVALFDELDEIHRRARPDFFQPFDGPARSHREVEQWLSGPGSTVLVAERGADVIGLVLLLTRPVSAFAGAVPRKVIEIDNLVVRADQRGWRVGRRLLVAAVEWARGQGATHVEVAVHAFNQEARRFYENFGFAPSVDRLVLTA
jgi:GNAT superfamily N-acetyltransferase